MFWKLKTSLDSQHRDHHYFCYKPSLSCEILGGTDDAAAAAADSRFLGCTLYHQVSGPQCFEGM